MYGLVVRFELLAGHEAAFDAMVSEMLRQMTNHEPQTLCYLVHEVSGSPRSRVFYELYADEAAFEAHEAASHVRQFLSDRQAHLEGAPEVWRVIPGPGMARPGLAEALG